MRTHKPIRANNRYYLGSFSAMKSFAKEVVFFDGVTVFLREEDFSVRLEVDDMRTAGTAILKAFDHFCDGGAHIDYLRDIITSRR